MTDTEILIAVARLARLGEVSPGVWVGPGHNHVKTDDLKFLKSRDAIAKVILMQPRHIRLETINRLCALISDKAPFLAETWELVVFAEPYKFCKSLLQATGDWKETPEK